MPEYRATTTAARLVIRNIFVTFGDFDMEKEPLSLSLEVLSRFTPKKELSRGIGSMMQGITALKARGTRMRGCASYLLFGRPVDTYTGEIGERASLKASNFCRDRLCPACDWRRSLKLFGQLSQCQHWACAHESLKWAMLTLTVVNPTMEDFSKCLDRMQQGWSQYRKRDFFKVVRGYCKALEVTYNRYKKTLHPHYHIMLALPASYADKAAGGAYIERDKWLKNWQECYGDFSISQVDIRLIKELDGGDVAEVSKYITKEADILAESIPWRDRVELLKALAGGLAGRRLVEYGGILRDAYKALKCEAVDSENADLVHIGDEEQAPLWLMYRYGWAFGAYRLLDTYYKESENNEDL